MSLFNMMVAVSVGLALIQILLLRGFLKRVYNIKIQDQKVGGFSKQITAWHTVSLTTDSTGGSAAATLLAMSSGIENLLGILWFHNKQWFRNTWFSSLLQNDFSVSNCVGKREQWTLQSSSEMTPNSLKGYRYYTPSLQSCRSAPTHHKPVITKWLNQIRCLTLSRFPWLSLLAGLAFYFIIR